MVNEMNELETKRTRKLKKNLYFCAYPTFDTFFYAFQINPFFEHFVLYMNSVGDFLFYSFSI